MILADNQAQQFKNVQCSRVDNQEVFVELMLYNENRQISDVWQ